MAQKIKQQQKYKTTVASVTFATVNDEALQTWLADNAGETKFALAHADDGVIWGWRDSNNWHWSGDTFGELSPRLSLTTLQECRLFGKDGEVYLWRGENNRWQTRSITDGTGEGVADTLDETQILWGTSPDEVFKPANGFAPLVDGTLANRHTPPVKLDETYFNPDKNYRPVRLQLRHYLKQDTETGAYTIFLSRLVAITAIKPELAGRKDNNNG